LSASDFVEVPLLPPRTTSGASWAKWSASSLGQRREQPLDEQPRHLHGRSGLVAPGLCWNLLPPRQV